MTTRPELALARILEALEAELIEASDEEITTALADLGMSPTKGSAALADLRFWAMRRHIAALYGHALGSPEAEPDPDDPEELPDGSHLFRSD